MDAKQKLIDLFAKLGVQVAGTRDDRIRWSATDLATDLAPLIDPKCDLCGDASQLHLRGKCHPTAPLRAEYDKGILSLYCYVPECNRLVAKLVCLPVEDIDINNALGTTSTD